MLGISNFWGIMLNMGKSYNRFFLRTVSFISFSLGFFWTIGVILDEAIKGSDPDWWRLFVLCFLTVFLAYSIILRKAPLSLTVPDGVAWWKPIIIGFLFACIWYLLLLPGFWWLGHLLVVNFWPNPNHSQVGLYNFLVALWLSAWWAPGLGALSYYFMPKKTNAQTSG